MRRGSQSAYQPATGNRSAMGNSKFTGGLEGSALIKSSAPANRKIEGHDFGKTTVSKVGGFEQTVNKLKNKPNKKVLQDQYINGLQEEIKLLQYELKLLKDKEIMQREGVNQLDNFLKDEIPINENILAMKNKYNATKNTLQEQFRQLSAKNIEAGDVLQTQKGQIQRLHQIIDGHRKQIDERNKEFKEKLSDIVRQLTLTKSEYDLITEQNRRKHEKMKKMGEEIATIQRAIEKQRVMQVRLMQEKSKGNEKFEEASKKTKQQMLQALQKVEQMTIHMQEKGTNPLADELEQKNSILRKKIMLNEKQKSTAENIISEMELFLKEEEREREIQRKEKLKYVTVADECRFEIQNIQRFTDNMIKDQTLRTKKVLMKEMTHDFKQKEEIYDLLSDRLRTLETECSNLIQQKKELNDLLDTQAGNEKQLTNKIKQLEAQILEDKCVSESTSRVTKQILQETGPIKNDLQKCQGRIPIIEKEIEKRSASIHHLNKQVDLLKELKGLDLDHLQMISTTGAQMQDKLHEFIKNWEKLKSL